MHNINDSLRNPLPTFSATYSPAAMSHAPGRPMPSASELASTIHLYEHDCVRSLQAIMRHPRSLARPTPTWRPPRKDLPSLALPHGASPELAMTITRHRVGARVKARVLGYGEDRVPAYLVTVRITDPSGRPVTPVVAEAWVRALVPHDKASAVHEITSSSAATFVWLVDSSYVPVHSPISLFADYSQAA